IAYARRLDTQLRAVFVHDTETGETHQVTDAMADAIDPVWDAEGQYLYFLASTDYALSTGWLDMSSYDRPVSRALYVASLAEGVASPLLPRSGEEEAPDEEGAPEDEGRDDEGQEGARAGEDAPPPDVVIDIEGIARRIVDAPDLPVGEYVG